MKIVILNSRERFRKEDLDKLDKHNAVFYEKKDNLLQNIKELKGKEEVVLGVQPSYLKGSWEGLTPEELNKYKNIKAISLSTTAFGWVPYNELQKKGVIVTNVPGKSTNAVAEYYVFMMIGLLRKLPLLIKKDWSSENTLEFMGTNATGLRVGIVGLGSIGNKIADLCKGYDMKVYYWNRSPKKSKHIPLSKEELFKTSDVVFLTTVSDENTKDLVSKQMIDSMKKSAILLSVSDGNHYNQEYVLKKVAENKLGGIGFEVDEQKMTDFVGNVFAAPEVGYYTHQTMDNESKIMTDSMISIVEGQPLNAVNI